MSTVRLLAFGLVMTLYLTYPVYLIVRQERVLTAGTTYRFQLAPVDPVDAFRGRYLTLSYDQAPLPVPEETDFSLPLYAVIAVDTLGFAYIDRLSAEPPPEADYFRTVAYPSDKGLAVPVMPETLQRYYLNEELAPLAEKHVSEILRQSGGSDAPIRAHALVRVWKGRALIEELYLDDYPLRQYLTK